MQRCAPEKRRRAPDDGGRTSDTTAAAATTQKAVAAAFDAAAPRGDVEGAEERATSAVVAKATEKIGAARRVAVEARRRVERGAQLGGSQRTNGADDGGVGRGVRTKRSHADRGTFPRRLAGVRASDSAEWSALARP